MTVDTCAGSDSRCSARWDNFPSLIFSAITLPVNSFFFFLSAHETDFDLEEEAAERPLAAKRPEVDLLAELVLGFGWFDVGGMVRVVVLDVGNGTLVDLNNLKKLLELETTF